MLRNTSGLRRILAAGALLATFTLAAPPLRADTLNVPGDAPTIQAAIVLAADGDTILVAPGTYVELLDLLGKRLVIEGSGGAASTIIDGAGAFTTITVGSLEPEGTALRGLTITGGTGQVVQVTGFQGQPYFVFGGGGVYVGRDAHLELTDCELSGNSVVSTLHAHGGGLLAGEDSSVTLAGCTFSGNLAEAGAGLFSFAGAHLLMSDCTVSGNTGGSAVDSYYAWGTVTHCLIIGNSGDGLDKTGFGPELSQCVFADNAGWGYAQYTDVGTRIADCFFLGNGKGGAYCLNAKYYPQSADFIQNCVFAEGDTLRIGNQGELDNCSFDGAVINHGNFPVNVRNSIVRGTTWIGGGDVNTTYSDVEGRASGVGDIDANPLWVNAAVHDYRLRPASPCIDTGDPASPLDADGSRADMGAIAFVNAFAELGGGVAGTAGPVQLAAHGTLIAGDGVVFKLSGATPFKPTLLVLGGAPLGVPFKGGTLWPRPDVLLPGLMTNAAGQLTLIVTWPSGIPTGFSLWAQSWLSDPGAVAGFAGSNGVRGTAP